MLLKRRALILLFPVAVMVTGCADRLHSFAGFAQGTRYEVIAVADRNHDTNALQRAVEAELRAIDKQFSNYRDDSVVERFNVTRSTQPIDVGEGLVALIAKARQVHEASRGCFDPTLAPLTKLWRKAMADQILPEEDAINSARATVGLEYLDIPDSTHLRKSNPGLEVDLSGIAQGESLARLADVLEATGIAAYSIEIGGEVLVRGAKPGGKPWRVAVLNPTAQDEILPGLIEHASPERRTIASSGTYASEAEVAQQRFSQIIDPATARPVLHDTVAVTVVYGDPALADAWSTALLCLGAERGLEVADQQQLAALFIQRDGRARASSAWLEARYTSDLL